MKQRRWDPLIDRALTRACRRRGSNCMPCLPGGLVIRTDQWMAVIAASRRGEESLVVLPTLQSVGVARRYLEDHGALTEHITFVTPGSAARSRGMRADVVIVDVQALRIAIETGYYGELTDVVDSVKAAS